MNILQYGGGQRKDFSCTKSMLFVPGRLGRIRISRVA